MLLLQPVEQNTQGAEFSMTLSITDLNIIITAINKWRKQVLVIEGDKESPRFDADTKSTLQKIKKMKKSKDIKPLNFNIPSILPSLLNHRKTQTIRRAWFDTKLMPNCHCNPDGDCDCKTEIVPAPPRYKVGDVVPIVWKQKEKQKRYGIFCTTCGTEVLGNMIENLDDTASFVPWEDNCKCHNGNFFSKNLGKVEITEVFKIKMWKSKEGFYFVNVNYNGKREYDSTHGIQSALAKADGSKNPSEMFKVLDKLYDLSKPRELWVYRWKWI